MKWTDFSDRMDQYIIKKDGTAVDIEYFMATHVPFRDLECIEFGDSQAKAFHLNEEQIYNQYIVNKKNKHQMLIVRGTNGTGKSHLICWLHNRFVTDKENYNARKEKVIFLQRLGNTVRGAVQQMLDEGIVQDPVLHEKFTKFCSAQVSQNEEEFKTSIYNEYVKRTQTDSTNSVYKQVTCKNIAAFLFDTRVQAYMMRLGGPVDKCYQMITAGAKTIVTDETETIFTVDDFNFPRKVANEIKRDAAEEVRNFYLFELRDDDKAIAKLVSYLNRFTSGVIQSCANITSQNARDLFVDLRKALYKAGKNLTIFIEDFTSFSIVESELITALSVENGGKYSNLCRVTSVIGITDGYYDSFRDNFKDRVTKQIKVTEQSYGKDNFLLEMAARYINAIYCLKSTVKDWYTGSNVGETMPSPEFVPNFAWDYVEIGDQHYTLYPFNKQSLRILYDKLDHKTPRNFLTHVIQHFFAQFAEGMDYKDDWRFPEMPSDATSVTLQPPYADTIENSKLSDSDKQRIKVVFKIWGDGTTEATLDTIGGISKKFLADIGLGDFEGVTPQGITPVPQPNPQDPNPNPGGSMPHQPSQKEIAFKRRLKDIEDWFEQKKKLEYAGDYNKWVGSFIVQSVAWQDEGLPGDFVTQRFRNGGFVYIEDSKLDVNKDKAVAVLKRSSEARTILMGLANFDFYKQWKFDNAAYYQFILIKWIEANKQTFINNIFGQTVGLSEHPVITWCLAIEYIHRLLYGQKLDNLTDEELLQILLKTEPPSVIKGQVDKARQDVIVFLTNKKALKDQIHTSLISGSNTVMGIVGEQSEGKVPFFRTSELLNSIEHLRANDWDLSKELTKFNCYQYDFIRKYLQVLYDKVKEVVKSEKKLAGDKVKEFEGLVGNNPTEVVYQEVANSIQEFYTTCNTAHEYYNSELKSRFDDAPIEQAKVAISCYNSLKNVETIHDNIELLRRFSQRPIERMSEIIASLNNVELFAKKLCETHKKLLVGIEPVDPLIIESAITSLTNLSEKIENMEAAE